MNDPNQSRECVTRRAFLREITAAGAALAGAGFLSGCGGGGGSSTASAPGYSPNLSQFTPNYAGQITLDHWPTMPVRVFFANDLTLTPQGGSPTRVNDIIRAGFDRWVAATNSVISYTVSSTASDAQITVSASLIPRPSGLAETGDTQLAASNHLLTAAATVIYVWSDITLDELTVGQVTTSAHEFGHALGIAGHSTNPSDVMSTFHGPTEDVPLSVSDINTLKTIYYFLF